MARPPVHSDGSVWYRQLNVLSSSNFIKPAGIWIIGCQSGGPASKMHTVCLPLADKRLANTQPAEPAPTIT